MTQPTRETRVMKKVRILTLTKMNEYQAEAQETREQIATGATASIADEAKLLLFDNLLSFLGEEFDQLTKHIGSKTSTWAAHSFHQRGFGNGVALFIYLSGEHTMYRVTNLETGRLLFAERSLALTFSRIFAVYFWSRNLHITGPGLPKTRVYDWLFDIMPPPDRAIGRSATYFVRTTDDPPHILNIGKGSYYECLCCLSTRVKAEQRGLVVDIQTHTLRTGALETRTVPATQLYQQFSDKLISLIAEELNE